MPKMNAIVPALSLALVAPLASCVYDNDPPRRLARDPAASAKPSAPAEATPPPRTPTSPAAGSPLLVEVDTDQTMNAVGGDGVGVFIEYGRGGKWHVWWTCDTDQTKQACDFAVGASVATGAITNVDATELAGGFITSPTPSRVDAKSTVTTEVRGIRFDTAPGAVITLEASVGGLKDGSFLFFVQNGKVNGGYAGKLTNPLMLQGATP
jgi:hypothetical protein